MYRKPTNRDDFIHYLSRHDKRTKTGVVLGFFLRAFRICSEEFLQAELDYIIKAFEKLKYPMGLLHQLRRKAAAITNKATRENCRGEYIIVPTSKNGEEMTKYLSNMGMKIAQSSGIKIGDLITTKKKREENKQSVVYEIPCSQCDSKYVGETSRGIRKRTNEHKQDIRMHKTSNSLVLHIDETGHLPNWDEVKVTHSDLDKKSRKLTEAAIITSNDKTTNNREGFFRLAMATAKSILTTTQSKSSPNGESARPGRPPERDTQGDWD